MLRLSAAFLTCCLLITSGWTQPWRYNCAPGCWMKTWGEWFDPFNPYRAYPVFGYCTWTGVCTNCYYGGMISCVTEYCSTYYQGTFSINCGCGEWWAGRCEGRRS